MNHAPIRLARAILAGAVEIHPEEYIKTDNSWRRQLVARFRLIAVHPFGRPTYWITGPESMRIARKVITQHQETVQAYASTRKLTRARKAGLL